MIYKPPKKVQLHIKHGSTNVCVWYRLNASPNVYRHKGKAHKKRALELAQKIAKDNSLDLETTDQRGTGQAY